jgi:hypothetical protein
MEEPVLLVDTFPTFLELWTRATPSSVEAAAELWTEYMGHYPGLLQKQIDCYREDGLDWRATAEERIFPFYAEYLERMQIAHGCVERAFASLLHGACARYWISPQPTLVVYVGVGCGAGWATDYEGRPAVLLGLEKVAECGWHAPDLVFRLIAHEYGHLYLRSHQPPSGRLAGTQAMALFEEGFAQRFDHLAAGAENWSLCTQLNDPTWAKWCTENRGALCKEYLRLIDVNEPSNAFFGDWLNVSGRKQVGYYLGHELIKDLERAMTIEEIAELRDVESKVRAYLLQGIRGET